MNPNLRRARCLGVWLSLLSVFLAGPAWAADYYVAPTGDDGQSGDAAHPFQTISRGINALSAGDTLWVHGGTYYENLVIDVADVTIRNVAGERPVIDGDLNPADGDGYYDLPPGDNLVGGEDTGGRTFSWLGLVDIIEPNVVFQGFDLLHSKGRGIRVLGAAGSTVADVRVYKAMEQALGIWGTDMGFGSSAGVTIERCLFEEGTYRDKFSGFVNNWGGAVGFNGANDVIFRDNIVRYSWGDSLLVDTNWNRSDGALIEGNFFYDGRVSIVYIHATSNIVFRNNMMFTTAANPAFTQSYPMWGCIIMQAQEINSYNRAGVYGISNVEIYNNIGWGCRISLVLGTQAPGAYYSNVRIHHNTMVNLGSGGIFETDSDYITVSIDGSGDYDLSVTNNIFAHLGADSIIGYRVAGNFPTGLVFSNNLWNERPDAAPFAADLEAADVGLVGQDGTGSFSFATNWNVETLAEHRALAEWFRLQADSAARDSGAIISDPPAEDYFGTLRPQGAGPDIGAVEWTDALPVDPDAGPTDGGLTEDASTVTSNDASTENPPDGNGGCSCQSSPEGLSFLLWLPLLLFLGFARRFRSTQRLAR